MRDLVFRGTTANQRFQLVDPDGMSESEFQMTVAEALLQAYPNHTCVGFSGTFAFEAGRWRPDLALVASDFSHWFIIEVELTSHSFEGHVLPQVRAFRYGDPESDCVGCLSRELSLDPRRARTLLEHVPRGVAVVINKPHPHWTEVLRSHEIQTLVVHAFRSSDGNEILEIEGRLRTLRDSLGFGKYSATERSLRFPRTVPLPMGRVQIEDPRAGVSWWLVSCTPTNTWVTKEQGVPAIQHGAYVQIIRMMDGRLCIRHP